MKLILKNTGIGLFIAVSLFALIGVVFDVSGGGVLTLTGYGYTKMLLATVAIGIGFGTTASIYAKENWPLPLRCVFHMGIGCAVYLVAAFAVGWISTTLGLSVCLVTIGGQLAVSALIWLGFMLYYRREARRLDDAICNGR